MTNKIRFTKDKLINLPSVLRRTRFHDDKVDGLILEVTPKGTKTFRVYKRLKHLNSPLNVTIGRFPDITIEQARRKASEELSKIAGGVNPNKLRKVEDHSKKTFIEIYDDYKTSRTLKEKTLTGYDQAITCYLADWHRIPLIEIDEQMIKDRYRELSIRSKGQANLTMRVVRALFNFAKHEYKNAERKSVFLENPVQILNHLRMWNNVPRKESRILQSDFKVWFQTIADFRAQRNPFMVAVCDYLELSILTGLRREELMSLRWDQVNMKNRSLHLTLTKNNDPLEIPVSNYAYTILERRQSLASNNFVFQADNIHGYIREPKKSVKKIIDASGISFMINDLRRTFISIATSLGTSLYILKRLMNHRRRDDDVTQGYIILTAEELRKPSQDIENAILSKAGLLSLDSEASRTEQVINSVEPSTIQNMDDIMKLSEEQKASLLAEFLRV